MLSREKAVADTVSHSNRFYLMALVALLAALAGSTTVMLAVKLVADDSGAPPMPQVISGSEDRGPPAVQGAEAAPLEPPDFQTVTGVGFNRASAALPAAIGLVPFEVNLPSYVPGQLRLAYVAARLGDTGSVLEVNYTVQPDGKPLPSLRLNWSPADPSSQEPVQAFSDKGVFSAGGREWRYYIVNWRDFDTIEARTVTDAGIQEFVEIRVIGMDHAAALSELQKVIASRE